MSSIAEKVVELIVEELNVTPEQAVPEAHFINDLGADSLDTVELVMKLETEFDIEIPDEDSAELMTVGSAIKYIESKQG